MTRQPFFAFPRHGLSAIAMSFLACGSGQALTLDDFESGVSELAVPGVPVPPGGAVDLLTPALVPGGTRSLGFIADPQSTGLVFMSVARGDLEAYASPTQPLSMSLGYGSSAPMNLDLGSLDFLRLDMIWAAAQIGAGFDTNALEMTIYATTSNGMGLNPDGSAMHTRLRGGVVMDIPFTAFAINSVTGEGVDWADVDGLLFVVSEVKPMARGFAGFGIRSIEVLANPVPEPATWALVGAGLLGLAWRRRPARD